VESPKFIISLIIVRRDLHGPAQVGQCAGVQTLCLVIPCPGNIASANLSFNVLLSAFSASDAAASAIACRILPPEEKLLQD
jgi:hypothetical protein